MKEINSEIRLCYSCMNEHDVKTVEIKEDSIYKEELIKSVFTYSYCKYAEDLIEDEKQILMNSARMKVAYNNKMNRRRESDE